MSKSKEQIKISLRRFNMQWIGDNKIIVLIGPRTRGKTTILLDYLYYHQDIPFCTCISPTDELNSTYSPHIPSRFIFTKYTPELLTKFVQRQKELAAKQEAAKNGYGDPRYKEVDCRGLLIMDDCLADSEGKQGWRKDTNLRWVFMNGRHGKITLILTMQYQVGIPPELRVNIDWVFLCRETKKLEKDKLHKYYAGIFPDATMFSQIFNSCTRDKRCMVIDALSESDKIEEQVYWYLAETHEGFRICYNEFWKDNELYLQRRMMVNDPTTTTGAAVAAQKTAEDDYYKYVGGSGRNKVRYNLDMEGENSGEAAEAEEIANYEAAYAQNAGPASPQMSSYGYGTQPSRRGPPGHYASNAAGGGWGGSMY